MSAGLFDHHREFLAARAISADVIAARGYSSTTLAEWLHGEGFSHQVSRLVPGLVIPVRDVHGEVRYHQYRPDRPRELNGKLAKYETPYQTRLVIDVPPQACGKLASPNRPLWITEGPLKADAGVSAGLVCVGVFGVFGWRGRNSRGGKTMLPDWEFIALEGREIFLAADSDVATNPDVANAVARLGRVLGSRGADVRYVFLPPAADGGKVGLDDWLHEHGPDTGGLLTLADDEPPVVSRTRAGGRGVTSLSKLPARDEPPAQPCTLDEAETVIRRWLRLTDMHPVRALLAVAVASALPGDPVWLLLVAAASSAKTELLSALRGHEWAHPAGVITEAGLLSGTSDKERAADATGGLLRQVGKRGVLICKDFGSLLSMQRDTRAATLAALREVYDGSWDRPVGSDGGKVLHWHGHCVLLGGVTPTIDRHHAVIGVLGDRYLMARFSESDDPEADAMKALTHAEHETVMRAEIKAAVHGVIAAALARRDAPCPRSDDDSARLARLAVFAARARTAIDRDGYTGELLTLPAVEGPGRLVKQLARLHAALTLIGDPDPMGTTAKVALDCVPAVRARLLAALLTHPDMSTRDIATGLGMSTKTAGRHLEDLALLKLATRGRDGEHATAANKWTAGKLLRSAADEGLTRAWTEMSHPSPMRARDTTCTVCGEPLHPSLAAAGDTTHPACDPDDAEPPY